MENSMGFLDSMSVSASALTATRMRMDIVAENMANVNTTRTAEGTPYRRKYVVFQEMKSDKDVGFTTYLNRANRTKGGVRVSHIGYDESEYKLDFNPTHPDADEEGYVRMPNVDVVQEMVDMMSAYRAYEANITAINAFKDMAVKTLELGKG